MSVKIQVRRGTTSEWTTTNPVLSSGELGYDTDLKIFKIGDGVAAWNSLAVADKDQQTAAQVPYSNTTSDLDAVNVQAALDELAVMLTSGDLEVDLSTAAGTALVWNAQTEQFDVDFADNTAAIAGESTTKVINPATLGTVLSNKIASQADAEAGTDNTVLMTPLRTAQAIAELAGESGGTGSANVTNYEVVINASDTWARDQITVVETEDYVQSESSEYPLSATVNASYYLETEGPQAGSARYSTFDGVSLESRAGVSSGFWNGATRVQAFLNDVLVLDGVKFENLEIIQEIVDASLYTMGGAIVIDPRFSILAPTEPPEGATSTITYDTLRIFTYAEEGVSGDGIHAVNDATHIYRYGDKFTGSTTYDLPDSSTDFNKPSTPIIVTFDFIDDENNTIVFSSTVPEPAFGEWNYFYDVNEIIYIQFANLPAFSNAIQSYGVEIGAAEYGFKPLLSYGFGTGSESHTVSDLNSKGLWTNNAVIAIRNTDSQFFSSPMAFTFYKDYIPSDVMTLVSDIDTVLQKINKETFVQEQEVILSAENLYEVFNIAIDSTHVYILTADIDDVYEVQKYLKSDLSFVAKETLADLKLAIAQDDDYLYIGGVESGFYVPDGVGFYDKETLEKVVDTSAYGSVIESVFVDDQYLYAAGGDYEQFAHPVTVWSKDLIFSPAWDTSITKLANPETVPTGQSNGTAFSSDGTYLAVTQGDDTPFFIIYKRDGDTFTKLADPEILPTYPTGAAFSPDDTYLAVAQGDSPYIIIYKRDGDTFTKLDDPDILPAGVGRGTAFSPDGTYLAVINDNSQAITIYKRSGDTFTKLPDLDEYDQNENFALPFYPYGVAFSPDGTYLAVAGDYPYIFIYKRSGDTFTKLADPEILPSFFGWGTAFSPDGTYLAVVHMDAPFITIYKRDGDTFTKLANPATLPTGDANGTAFSNDGTYLAVAHSTTPFITIYKREGDTFTKIPDPTTLPAGAGAAVAFRGAFLAVGHSMLFNNSLTIYKTDFNVSIPELVGTTPDYPGIIKSVIVDDNFIYAAGEQDPIADSIIVKYSKETLEIVGTSAAVGGAVDKLEQDGDFIYALSIDAEAIKQYAKSDLSLISTLTIDYMQSFTQDTDFIYSFEAVLGELSKSTKGSLSYNLTKAVSGITAEDDPIVDIDLSTNKFTDVVPIQEAWGLVYRLDTLEDEVQLYATEEPEFPANTTVKLKVVK
jgi:WD40 repeat protein